MTLTERLLNVALFGAEWVLWLLIALSIVSVALMIERLVFFRRTKIDPELLDDEVRGLLRRGELDAARARLERHPGALEAGVLLAGLDRAAQGAAAAASAMQGAKTRGRQRFRRNLSFLGTLGNNAPFIGLFGTVLGVIKAFHDLAAKRGQGPEAVMGSLSEALIATAVGLLVAIPAVAAFNSFNGVVRRRVAQADALSQDLLAELADERGARRAEAA